MKLVIAGLMAVVAGAALVGLCLLMYIMVRLDVPSVAGML